MSEEKKYVDVPLCKFNEGVQCEGGNCDKCGWNPSVAERRVKKFKDKLVVSNNMYSQLVLLMREWKKQVKAWKDENTHLSTTKVVESHIKQLESILYEEGEEKL